MEKVTFNLSKELRENGFVPTLDAYILERNNDGLRPLVLVIPGGAYGEVAENWEGERIALSYVAAGLNAAVLNYSVAPYRYPTQVLEAASAISICRKHAEEWQVDTQKIAVCGFSAGGHLAASISNLWCDPNLFSCEEIKNQTYRPNATILSYPVITSGENRHHDSFVNLLGIDNVDDPLWKHLSLEDRVSVDTAPTFLWHTVEDPLVPVENSMLYAVALQKKGVPFELHIYPKGAHGLSLTTQNLPRTRSLFAREYNWMKLSIDWLCDTFNI